MRTVYVETSVWGMVPPDQNPTLRRPTLEFLRRCEKRQFLAHVSDVVTNEIRKAPDETHESISRRIVSIKPIVLSLLPEVHELVQRFIAQRIVPQQRLDDAQHVACALVHELDVLLTWNYEWT